MAATRLIAMHQNKGKTIQQCLKDRTDYAENEEKTAGGELVSSYMCNPETVAAEFAASKREYLQITGRIVPGDIIAYQIRQSFKPESDMKPRCGGQRGIMLLSLRRILTVRIFITTSFIIPQILTAQGSFATLLFAELHFKESVIWSAWKTDYP